MNALVGVLFHFIGGFASGSFYVPYKKVRDWSWESMWILGGVFLDIGATLGSVVDDIRFLGNHQQY